MKIKKIISGIMAVLVVAGAVPAFSANPVQDYAVTASAADYTEGTYESLKYKKYSDYVEISRCDKSATEVVIPTEIEGLPVTKIGRGVFAGCEILESVTIPDSVIHIGAYAFQDCSSLTEITIPDSVTSIEVGAFTGCSSLKSITIPEGITIIRDSLFESCSNLVSVTLPESVQKIERYAFNSCFKLTSITIPCEVTRIGYGAFYFCSGLTDITIPDSVTTIENTAFGFCENLASITILNPYCEIADSSKVICNECEYDTDESYFKGIIYGYENSTAQEYAEKYGRKFESLGEYKAPEAYENLKYEKYSDHVEITGCDKSLTEVVIPAEIDGLPVTDIGLRAFWGCSGLTSITIPDSVTSIGNSAFVRCSGLTEITIPESVTSIGGHSFYNCSGLTSITILNPDCKIYDNSGTICSEYNSENQEHYFNGTIKGYETSTAQEYAEKYGYKFESIGEIEAPETLFGDANCDGEISVADATLVLQYCGNKDKYKLTEQGLINADVDGTAGISAVDALVIQQADAGIYKPEDLPLKK